MAKHLHYIKLLRGLSLWLVLLLTACAAAQISPEALDRASGSRASNSLSTLETVPSNTPLLVAAAANAQFAFAEIGQNFTKKTGQPVEFSFGSSGNLTTQIENGAPFDIFVAANEGFVDRLKEQGLILPDTQQLYAQGRIVLAVNGEAGLQATSLEDLLDPKITWVAIANPDLAPYGLAAREALQGAGVWEALQPKLVLAENIRQTLQFVQTGDAPVGIIALAVAEVPEVSYTILPVELHNPLNQSMAVVKSTQNEAAARAFLEFILSPEGQAILKKYGFQSFGRL